MSETEHVRGSLVQLFNDNVSLDMAARLLLKIAGKERDTTQTPIEQVDDEFLETTQVMLGSEPE